MPYITVTLNGKPLEQRELKDQPLIIGRSADCDLPVHDILLSRHHCRIEPCRGGWKIIDLESRNGTRMHGQKIRTRMLLDGDMLRLGRSWLEFHISECMPELAEPQEAPKPARPADPFEALSGTLADYIYREQDDDEYVEDAAEVVPSPVYPGPDVLVELASSLWDYPLAAAEPTTQLKTKVRPRVMRPSPRPVALPRKGPRFGRAVSQSLQAEAEFLTEPAPPAELAEPELAAPEPATPARVSRWRSPGVRRAILATTGALLATAATTIVMLSGWILARG